MLAKKVSGEEEVKWEEVKPKLANFVGLVTYKESKIVFDTAVRLKAKSILELGIGQGAFSTALLYACSETGGKLTSLTLDANFKQELFTDKYPELNAVKQNWAPIKMDCLKFAKTWTEPLDLLVIDCDHGYEHTKKELEAYAKFVKDNGEILLHDVLHAAHGKDILNAVQEFIMYPGWLADPKYLVWNLNIINTTCGMGRMYKVKPDGSFHEGCGWTNTLPRNNLQVPEEMKEWLREDLINANY